MKQGNYNFLLYKDKVDNVYNVVNNKGYNINKQLYDVALKNYIKQFCFLHNITSEEFNEIFNIVKIPNYEYDKPCSIIQQNVLNNTNFKTQYIIDLTAYWPNYEYKATADKTIVIDSENNFGEDKVEYIDYVRGEAIVFNSYTGIRRALPIKNITSETVASDNIEIINYGR